MTTGPGRLRKVTGKSLESCDNDFVGMTLDRDVIPLTGSDAFWEGVVQSVSLKHGRSFWRTPSLCQEEKIYLRSNQV